MSHTKKALVLSGGGGRGAYHIGVIEALIEQGWMEDGKGPDILAGTSIGAINAAALALGLTVAQLQQHWMLMQTENVHQLSDDVPTILRPFMRFVLHSVLTSESRSIAHAELPLSERALSATGLLERLGHLFHTTPFRSLLDTKPWRNTLVQWMNFDRINSPESPTLLLTATNMQRGTLEIFCNRQRKDQPPTTITLDHLMASSSIPAVYPWTTIENNNYWDGAVVANTPLEAVIDMIGVDEDADILVVMMTPWHEEETQEAMALEEVPHDMVQALSLTLDWSMLASYRTTLKLLRSYNQIVEATEKLDRAAQQTGDESLRMQYHGLRRMPLPTIIAPVNPMPMDWIIDYEEANHRTLFRMGKEDALRALSQRA